MNAMVASPPIQLNHCRVRLAASPAAAGEARSQVRTAIRDWGIPVDPDAAGLAVYAYLSWLQEQLVEALSVD